MINKTNTILFLMFLLVFISCREEHKKEVTVDSNTTTTNKKLDRVLLGRGSYGSGLFIDTTRMLDFKKYFKHINKTNIINSNNVNKPIFLDCYYNGIKYDNKEESNYPINTENGNFVFYAERVPQFIPVFKTELNDYIILAFSIDITSSNTLLNKMYILSFTKAGKYIDCVESVFILGKRDIKLYLNSNFVKKYNNAGYTEICLSDKAITCHNTMLRLFNNGSEILYSSYTEYSVDNNGKFIITDGEKEEITYYKHHKLNKNADKKVKTFK